MSITLKIILLFLGVLALIGCVFWWHKEGGWEPKVATVGALSTILVLIFNLTQKNESSGNTISIEKNVNSPIANTIGTQNIYYGQESPKEKQLKQETPKPNNKIPKTESKTNIKLTKLTFKGDSPGDIYDTVNKTADLLKQKIANSFILQEIDWICSINRISKLNDDIVSVVCNQDEPGRNTKPGIHIKLKLKDYPQLMRIKGGAGQRIRIKGKIEDVSQSGSIRIDVLETEFL